MSPREPLRRLHPEIFRPAPTSVGAWLGGTLARFLFRRRHAHGVSLPTDPAHLAACLKPGEVLLVEGESRFSIGTKYLMQSTWSHAALYVGAALGDPLKRCVVEADMIEGIRAVGLDEFACLHLRVCWPVGPGPASGTGGAVDDKLTFYGESNIVITCPLRPRPKATFGIR